MKNLILSILLDPTFILSDYLQDGLYPECSYVIVDQDGWKTHMNQDGKVISMTPKSKHNDKMGFHELPRKDIETSQNTESFTGHEDAR